MQYKGDTKSQMLHCNLLFPLTQEVKSNIVVSCDVPQDNSLSQPQDTFMPHHSEDYWSYNEEDNLPYQRLVNHSRDKKDALLHVNSLRCQLFNMSEKEHSKIDCSCTQNVVHSLIGSLSVVSDLFQWICTVTMYSLCKKSFLVCKMFTLMNIWVLPVSFI